MVKETSAWKPVNGEGDVSSVNDGVIRVTEAGDTRVTEAGDTRTLNATVVIPKDTTAWEDA